jgi:hypothetical protein
MKRLTLLTILLIVVGLASGFSLELKPSFTLAANAKVTWGINLDAMTTGFLNEETIDMFVILFADDTSDIHKGDGDWYGYIEVKEIELLWWENEASAAPRWTLAEDTDGTGLDDIDASAKIVGLGGALAIGVNAGPDTGSNVDFVASLEDDEDADYPVVDYETDDELDLGVNYDNYGTYVSYAFSDALTVGIEAVSQLDYNANVNNAYGFALDILAKFSPLTVTAGVNYGINYVVVGTNEPAYIDVFGFGLKVAADTDMVDGWVGFDGGMGTSVGEVTAAPTYSFGSDFQFEVGGGLTFTVFEVTTLAVDVTYGPGFVPVGFDDLDVKVVFTEPAAKGLVDNLDLTVKFWLLDIPDSMEWEANIDGGYLMGVWYPNFTVDVGDNQNLFADTTAIGTYMTIKVGIDYTGIPLTTLGLYWQHLDPINDVLGDILVSAKVTY